jgi:hypothetical protein
MRTMSRIRLRLGRWLVIAALASLSLLTAPTLGAQSRTELTRTLAAIASTPLGALTPTGPVMATSRDDTLLLGFRMQYGSRGLSEGRSLRSYGLTTNLQIQGGALVSGTLGYQQGSDDICAETGCYDHRLMAEVRYSNNLITTRPFLRVPFFTENDASGTAALQFGVGWAEKGFNERQHWTADITVPLSLAVGQRVRVVPFLTPSFAFAWGTTDRQWSRGQRFLVGGGITTQEVGKWMGLTGLDLSLAFQRAFSPHGTTLGATISWMHVPIR